MGDKTPAYFSSPLIQKITPIKRLGLSRKRKITGNDAGSSNGSQPGCDKFSTTPTKSPSEKILKLDEDLKEDVRSTNNEWQDKNSLEAATDCDDDVDVVNKRIKEKEEKLRLVQCEKKNITDLENLFELWKDGCKNAYLHFIELAKERQQAEGFNHKEILQKLGIWETMVENFSTDFDLCLLESS